MYMYMYIYVFVSLYVGSPESLVASSDRILLELLYVVKMYDLCDHGRPRLIGLL